MEAFDSLIEILEKLRTALIELGNIFCEAAPRKKFANSSFVQHRKPFIVDRRHAKDIKPYLYKPIKINQKHFPYMRQIY